MASRLRTWVRRVTTPHTRALARSVAVRMLEGVASAGARVGSLATNIRPAIAGQEAGGTPAQVEVVPPPHRAPSPPPPPPPVDPGALGWMLARHVSEQLDPLIARLLDAAVDLSADTHDAETLRVMRVSSRRLRSAAQVFGPWIGAKRTRRLEANLRAITRALGPLRDLDSVIARFNAVTTDEAADPLRRAAAEHVLHRLAKPHATARRRAHKAIGRVDADRLRRDLRQAKRSIIEHLTTPCEDVRPPLLALLEPQIVDAFAQTPVPTTLDDLEAVHDVRIIAKRLRYAFEWIKPGLTEGPGPKRLLKRTQRVVGDARDLALLEAELRGHADALREAQLPTLATGLESWLREVEVRRAKAESKILRVLADLSPRVVLRLTAVALGQDPASRVTAPPPV